MRKFFGIIVLCFFSVVSVNTNADIPNIKVEALECVAGSIKERAENQFIFFSQDKKKATSKMIDDEKSTVTKVDYKVISLSYSEITLKSENNNQLYMKIDRTNGKLSYEYFGSTSKAGQCKEYKKDLALENIWKKMIDRTNKKKESSIKF